MEWKKALMILCPISKDSEYMRVYPIIQKFGEWRFTGNSIFFLYCDASVTIPDIMKELSSVTRESNDLIIVEIKKIGGNLPKHLIEWLKR